MLQSLFHVDSGVFIPHVPINMTKTFPHEPQIATDNTLPQNDALAWPNLFFLRDLHSMLPEEDIISNCKNGAHYLILPLHCWWQENVEKMWRVFKFNSFSSRGCWGGSSSQSPIDQIRTETKTHCSRLLNCGISHPLSVFSCGADNSTPVLYPRKINLQFHRYCTHSAILFFKKY